MGIDNDRRVCEEITERSGPNFSIGFRTLPPPKLRAIQASYAFCRIADDVADLPSTSGADVTERLTQWREELDRVYEGSATHPVGRALAESLREFSIPRKSFEDLIEGCRRDADFVALQTQRDLEAYCDLVATSMGRICLSIFGECDPRAPQWARALSHALQMTNILRDVREDFERGRIYFPLEWLQEADVSPQGLVEDAPRLGWYELMARGVEFSRVRFRQSLRLVQAVDPDSRLAVALMRGVYMEILQRIEEDPRRVLRERITLDQQEQWAVARRAQMAAGSASVV